MESLLVPKRFRLVGSTLLIVGSTAIWVIAGRKSTERNYICAENENIISAAIIM